MKQNGIKFKIIAVLILFNIFNITQAQNYELCNNKWKADSLFKQNDFFLAKEYYSKIVNSKEVNQRVELYYLACCYANLNKIDSSIITLNKAIEKGLRYISVDYIELDTRLAALKETKHWRTIKLGIQKNIENYNKRKPLNIELKKEFLKRKKQDQGFRKLMAASNDSFFIDSILRLQNKIDLDNQIYLDEIINKYGCPTISLVGDTASHVAWLIVQHADNNVEFQEKYLPYIMKAAWVQQVKLTEVAYLHDRILVNKGLPQIYGTQFKDTVINMKYKIIPKPIKNIKEVDKFRHFVGLNSLMEYLNFAEKKYKKD